MTDAEVQDRRSWPASCPGFWFRRSCRHFIAYREARALVAAQDAVNVAWDTPKGGNVAVRGSQKGI